MNARLIAICSIIITSFAWTQSMPPAGVTAQSLTNPSRLKETYLKLQKMAADSENKARAAADQINELGRAIRSTADLVDTSAEGVRTVTLKFQSENDAAELDLTAKTARQHALAEALAKLSKEIEIKTKADPIAEQIEAMVKVRELDLERKQKAGQAYSQGEIEVTSAILAEARVKLLERREAAAAAAGGDTLAVWNRELLTLSVDMAELQARCKSLRERLDRILQASRFLEERARLQQRLAEFQEDEKQLHQQLQQLEAMFQASSGETAAPTTSPGGK